MELIIGGAFQGKSEYAKKHFPQINWVNGNDIAEEQLLNAQGILHFHEYIKNEMKQEHDVSALAKKITERNPLVVLVSDEVGYGVVPVDAFERAYREAVGRICTELAAYSSRVTRVICGTGMVIKDA